jgi:hypothetical protein
LRLAVLSADPLFHDHGIKAPQSEYLFTFKNGRRVTFFQKYEVFACLVSWKG